MPDRKLTGVELAEGEFEAVYEAARARSPEKADKAKAQYNRGVLTGPEYVIMLAEVAGWF